MARSRTLDPNEAFSRIKVDALLMDGHSLHFEYGLPDGTKADYVLCDRHGRSLAAIETKRASINPRTAEKQATDYVRQLGVPFVLLTNGAEVWFWEHQREAHPHAVKTFFAQEDLERRTATPLTVAIDPKIAGRNYRAARTTAPTRRPRSSGSRRKPSPRSWSR